MQTQTQTIATESYICNSTYSPLLSTAMAWTGPLWHNIFTKGSFTLGLQNVTVPTD